MQLMYYYYYYLLIHLLTLHYKFTAFHVSTSSMVYVYQKQAAWIGMHHAQFKNNRQENSR